MTAVSVLALMISLPAYAGVVSATGDTGGTISSSPPARNDGGMQTSLNKVGNALDNAGDDIKAFFISKTADNTFEPVLIHRNMTANGLIGETIVNDQGKKIAAVNDIIIDRSGKVILIVVSDNGFLGIGDKVAAFDYDSVVSQNPDGRVVVRLSQNMVYHAADFSYDRKDWAKAKVIPSGSISVNALLKGDILDSQGRKVADIENIYLRNADVSQIIVGFDKTLGMGGNLAALDYDDLQMVKKNKALDFKLTSDQTAQFKSFKKSVAN